MSAYQKAVAQSARPVLAEVARRHPLTPKLSRALLARPRPKQSGNQPTHQPPRATLGRIVRACLPATRPLTMGRPRRRRLHPPTSPVVPLTASVLDPGCMLLLLLLRDGCFCDSWLDRMFRKGRFEGRRLRLCSRAQTNSCIYLYMLRDSISPDFSFFAHRREQQLL